MGKKNRKRTGAALRTKKRTDALQEQLAEEVAIQAEGSRITKKSNEELFTIDNEETIAEIVKVKTKRKKPTGLSEKDQQKVNKLLKTHNADELKKLAAKKQPNKRKKDSPFDLWTTEGSDNDQTAVPDCGIGSSLAGTAPLPVRSSKKGAPHQKPLKTTIAVQVAHGGQSYRPDEAQHQDVIGEALALELKRQQAHDDSKAPISTGLDKTTRALLVGSSDEESSSDEEEDDKNDASIQIKKKKEKKTRAVRNRQKRIRAQEEELQKKKRAKQFLNELSEIKKHNKELTKHERELQLRKEMVQTLKQQTKEKEVLGKDLIQKRFEKDPINAPTLPVALTEEVDGSIRRIRPKGSLITDRMESLVDRNMANRQQKKGRRIVQGKKRKVRGKDVAYLLKG